MCVVDIGTNGRSGLLRVGLERSVHHGRDRNRDADVDEVGNRLAV